MGEKGGAIPMSAGAVFLIRVGLGVLFGFIMMKMFHPRGGILAAGIVTVFLVGMAYLLAQLRKRREEEERGRRG
jgi:membrane-bound ClpP family serine protease